MNEEIDISDTSSGGPSTPFSQPQFGGGAHHVPLYSSSNTHGAQNPDQSSDTVSKKQRRFKMMLVIMAGCLCATLLFLYLINTNRFDTPTKEEVIDDIRYSNFSPEVKQIMIEVAEQAEE